MRNYKAYSVQDATRILANYCAYQERCHKEVAQKLRDMNMIPEAREQILIYLIENDFLNEERFAKAYARGKFNHKKWGKLRITQELKSRDISAYNIKAALAEIPDQDYYETLLELGYKKWDSINETSDYKRRIKLVNHLIYKGYERNIIHKATLEIAGKI
jgi:regulatory protein